MPTLAPDTPLTAREAELLTALQQCHAVLGWVLTQMHVRPQGLLAQAHQAADRAITRATQER